MYMKHRKAYEDAKSSILVIGGFLFVALLILTVFIVVDMAPYNFSPLSWVGLVLSLIMIDAIFAALATGAALLISFSHYDTKSPHE